MSAWISPSDVQAWLGPDVNNLEAAALALAASDAVRDEIERDLELHAYDELLDSQNSDHVLLNHWPIRTLTSITIDGGPPLVAAGFNVAGYQLDPVVTRMVRFPGRRIPRGISNIHAIYTAGYDLGQPVGSATGLPASVARALLLTVSAIYNSQAADPNLVSENTGGVFSGSFHARGVGAVPPGALTLLRGYRRVAP